MAAKHSLPDTKKPAGGDSAEPVPSENQETTDAVSAVDPSRVEVIRKRADFIAANRGKRFVTPDFVLLCHRRRPLHPVSASAVRFGITVTKKIGNAVARNRMKRRFRALVAETLPEYGIPGVDHILIGRKQRQERDFEKLRADLVNGLKHLAKKL
ncbi:ribonuclease P protein component [Parasphingorhabdus sp.]|uniref:ribonuclease P protein component n=1 Tax=Parasphingorhabdus sp. TaxID=2709688 RepID=UPI00326792B5